MRGIYGKSRLPVLCLILGLILLAGMLGLTGYLLRVRAVHHDRQEILSSELDLSRSMASGPMRSRESRAEYHVNRYLLSFPRSQARAAAELIAVIHREAVREWSIRSAGTGLRFHITPERNRDEELVRALTAHPDLLRLDRCGPRQSCVRGMVGIE